MKKNGVLNKELRIAFILATEQSRFFPLKLRIKPRTFFSNYHDVILTGVPYVAGIIFVISVS